MIGYKRVTKRQWHDAGGFKNARCVRTQRGDRWAYFIAKEE